MLYIMRHGKTEWNIGGKLQGKTDIPLCGAGRKAARAAAAEYSSVNIDICYCSPLVRARETAEIFLRGRSVPIIPDERLSEMGFGIYEGTENAQSESSPLYGLFSSPQNYLPDGGVESFESLFARTGDFLRKVAAPLVKLGKNVLIVGHGAMNASIICRVCGIPLKDFWSALTDNCKLVELALPDGDILGGYKL